MFLTLVFNVSLEIFLKFFQQNVEYIVSMDICVRVLDLYNRLLSLKLSDLPQVYSRR